MNDIGNKFVANIFKALSSPMRLKIIYLLKNKPLCVCEIIKKIEAEQSNVSQHLAILKNQGILENKKDGLRIIYSIKNKEINNILEIAEKLILRQIEDTKRSLLRK